MRIELDGIELVSEEKKDNGWLTICDQAIAKVKSSELKIAIKALEDWWWQS